MKSLISLTTEGQIALIVSIAILALIVLIVLIKNKGRISTKNLSLDFSQKTKADNRVEMIGQYLINILLEMRRRFYSNYLKLLKEAGCPEDILNENEDARYVDQMLGNIVWSGNGIKSIKSVIEKHVLDKSFLTFEYSVLISMLMRDIEGNAKTYVNGNYETEIKCPDGSERKRIVDNTMWVDSLRANVTDIRPLVEEFVTYSRSLYKDGKK